MPANGFNFAYDVAHSDLNEDDWAIHDKWDEHGAKSGLQDRDDQLTTFLNTGNTQSWTSTVLQAATTITIGLDLAGRPDLITGYSVFQDYVDVQFRASMGSAGVAGEVTVQSVGLPRIYPSSFGFGPIGQFLYSDDSAGLVYVGVVELDGTGIFYFRVHNAATRLGATPVFTVAALDVLMFTARYRSNPS